MIAVVTGSNGFIGSHLVDLLLSEGLEVHCLIRRPYQGAPPPERLVYHVVDYADPATLGGIEALGTADYVFHLAGVTKATTLDGFRAGNIDPTRHLLAAIRARRPAVDRFVLVSSMAAAGPAPALDRPVTEADPPAPFEAYGQSKLEAEQVVAREAGPVAWSILRPAAVYGPRDVDFLALYRQIRWGFSLHPANRDKYTSIVYVNDLVSGILDAARSPAAAGETFFLSNREPVTWSDLSRLIAGVMDKPLVEVNIPAWVVRLLGRGGDLYARVSGRTPLVNSQKVRLSMPRFTICSSEHARRTFGFATPTSLREGLAATLAWYRSERWL